MSSSSTSITSNTSKSRTSRSSSRSSGSSSRRSHRSSSTSTSSSSSSSSSSNSSDDDKQNVSFTLTDTSSEVASVKRGEDQEVEQQVVDKASLQENGQVYGWYRIFDVQSGLWYFYNSETAQSSWQLPEDVSPASVLEFPGLEQEQEQEKQEQLLKISSQQIETDQGQGLQVQGNEITEEQQFTHVQESNGQTDQLKSERENVEGQQEGEGKSSEDTKEKNQCQETKDKNNDNEAEGKVESVKEDNQQDNNLEVAYAEGLQQQQQQQQIQQQQYLQQYHQLAHQQQQQQQLHESQYSHSPGWYYYDFQQNVQGPFTTEQLRMWRQQLPMDLQLWYYDPSKPEDEEFICVHVYELFGDKNVYEHWQKATQGSTSGPAPTAPQWEEFMKMEQDENGGSYAAAVRAGLPAQDSAVQAHQLQQYVQHQIPDAMNFYYWAQNYYMAPGNAQYAQYAANAVRDRSGRIIAAETLPESVTGLYSEISSWCDPQEFERAMRERTERKRKQLPPAVWKKLKKRKQESKERIRRALLMM